MNNPILDTDASLRTIRDSLRSKTFRDLIAKELGRGSQHSQVEEIQQLKATLTTPQQETLFDLIDRWNLLTHDKDLWGTASEKVFDQLVEQAIAALTQRGVSYDAATLSSYFRSFVLTCGFNAGAQPNMREFMGLRTFRPFTLSGAVVAYIILECLFAVWKGTGDYRPAIRTALQHLAIFLVVAGIWSGTFRVFAIRSRFEVLALAAVLLAISVAWR